MKGWRAGAVSVLAVLGVCLAFAAGAAEIREGRDFRLVSPPLTAPKDIIEITEFFWYGCPHCFDFEPELAASVKRLPAGVSFRRVPALFPGDRYLVLTRGDYEELLATIDPLVVRVRLETGMR